MGLNEFGLREPPEWFMPPGSKCLVCQHGFNWPTQYWPIQDEYGNWYHIGCDEQPRPYMAINEEEQWWVTTKINPEEVLANARV